MSPAAINTRRIASLAALSCSLTASVAADVVVYDTITVNSVYGIVGTGNSEYADDTYLTAPPGWQITGADVRVGPQGELTPAGIIRISIWSSKPAPGGPMPDKLLGQASALVPSKIGYRVIHVDLPPITVPLSGPIYTSLWTSSSANWGCVMNGSPSIGQTTSRLGISNQNGSWYMTTESHPLALRVYAVPTPGPTTLAAITLALSATRPRRRP